MAETDTTTLVRSADALIHELSAPLTNALGMFPLEAHLHLATIHNPYDYCESTPAQQAAQRGAILQQFGLDTALAYNRLALVAQVRNRLAPASDEVAALSIDWFTRILDDARKKSLTHYDPANPDNLQRSDLGKDFAVAAGRAMPIGGAWIAERRRQSRAELFSPRGQGNRRAPTILRHIKREIDKRRGAYGTYYVVHTAYRYRRGFTPRNMNKAYATLARLLQRNVDVEGIYRRSWFLDPEVSRINPRLGFLLDVPRNNGAVVRQCGPVPEGERPEIAAFSKARREQLDSGAYLPMEWAYFWPREEVLRWWESST